MRAWPKFAVLAAFAAVLAFLITIYGYRLGAWGLFPVFDTMKLLTPILGIGALLSVAAAGVLAFRREVLGAAAGLVVGAAALGFAILPVWMRNAGSEVPPIHDITTDTANPPEFVAILPLRADAANPAEYDREQTAQQREAYPEIQTLVMPVPLPEAFEIALDAVKAEGLKIVAAVPQEGRIEAVETIPLFGFKDDVVVRLRNAHDAATVVDIRSKSRVGRSDLGFNARRINSLIARMEKKGGRIDRPADQGDNSAI